MPLKKDILQLASIFILLIIFLIFGGYFLLLGSYLRVSLLLGSMIPLFLLMILKGKKMEKNIQRNMSKNI